MKLSLVVITPGKSQGQAIPINLAQFVIGRDPQCNLRPASALISKRHCALIIRGEKAFIRDFDSTNGTSLNDQPVKDEIELQNKDRLKVGPLLFEVQLEAKPSVNRPTPPPPTKKPAETPKLADTPKPAEHADDDSVAAMLLALQDEGGSNAAPQTGAEIPDGSTVMDISTVPPPEEAAANAQDEKASKSKVIQGNTSTAAKAILEKYMRRPRNV
jgi:pSer/pThr/pTyr-binding forkhead associated (FHA) protein